MQKEKVCGAGLSSYVSHWCMRQEGHKPPHNEVMGSLFYNTEFYGQTKGFKRSPRLLEITNAALFPDWS